LRSMEGSKTTPTVPIFAFSGCRPVARPPMVELICWLGSPLPATAVVPAPCAAPNWLQRAAKAAGRLDGAHGSVAGSALGAAPPYRSLTLGALKPVPYVPRKVTSRIGR